MAARKNPRRAKQTSASAGNSFREVGFLDGGELVDERQVLVIEIWHINESPSSMPACARTAPFLRVDQQLDLVLQIFSGALSPSLGPKPDSAAR